MHVSSVNTITGAQYYFKSPQLYWKEKVESLFKSKLNPQNAHIQCCRPKSPVTKTKSTTENKVLPITSYRPGYTVQLCLILSKLQLCCSHFYH